MSAIPEHFQRTTLKQLDNLRIEARRAFVGNRQGGHISARIGFGMEFSDFRAYEPGDNPRWIDWGVYGRTDKLFVRRYQEDQNVSLLILVDSSASMSAPEDGTKMVRACELAFSLGYIGLNNQELVSFSLLRGAPSPSFFGPQCLGRMWDYLQSTKDFKGEQLSLLTVTEMARSAHRAVSRLKFPGIAVLISDFLFPHEELLTLLNPLLARRLQIHAIQLVGDSDQSPFARDDAARAVDSENGAMLGVHWDSTLEERYNLAFTEHTNEVQEFCVNRNISFCVWRPQQPLIGFIHKELLPTGLLG